MSSSLYTGMVSLVRRIPGGGGGGGGGDNSGEEGRGLYGDGSSLPPPTPPRGYNPRRLLEQAEEAQVQAAATATAGAVQQQLQLQDGAPALPMELDGPNS